MKIANVVLATLGLGCAAIASVSIPDSPALAAASFGGGLFSASLLADDGRRRKEEDKRVESARVAKVFSFLYENNRGLVSPQQLAFNADITPERADIFLEALSQDQNGQAIPTQSGKVYNFPHPSNALDELTRNATAWADAKCEPLLNEIGSLKQQMKVLQAHAAINRGADIEKAAQTFVANNNLPQSPSDPWNNLL
jgi:hypothetical protein